MAYAHQGIELKNIPGVGPNGLSVGPILEGNKNEALRPVMLTNKGVQVLLRVERLMDEAGRAMIAASRRRRMHRSRFRRRRRSRHRSGPTRSRQRSGGFQLISPSAAPRSG